MRFPKSAASIRMPATASARFALMVAPLRQVPGTD